MGNCLFSSCHSSRPLDCVRVIRINGYYEDFAAPITVSRVTGKPAKHVLCSTAQLLSIGSRDRLRPDDALEPGRIYFLLPHSALQSENSAVDLASLAARLTSIAKRGGPGQTGSVSDADPKRDGSGVALPQRKCKCARDRTWKPVLESVREVSFRRKSSSRSSHSNSTSEGGT